MTQTHKRRAREDTRGRLYHLARPANTPHTGTSDKSLPGPAHPNYNPHLTQRGASIAQEHSVTPECSLIVHRLVRVDVPDPVAEEGPVNGKGTEGSNDQDRQQRPYRCSH